MAPVFPVVLLGDERISEIEKVEGLEHGAEDFISKPFGKCEFVARLRVSLRPQAQRPKASRLYSFANLSLRTNARRVRTASGKDISLSATEYNMLVAFLDHPQTILSRDDLIRATRRHAGELAGRSVDVLIVRLRRKIEMDGQILIRTIRGRGYEFAADVQVVVGRAS
ncbi:hypothetical protein GCM10010520_55670 [Rhizobium viscosum]